MNYCKGEKMISSNTLFHFTNEVDFLKNILKDNFYPRCCTEDLEFLMPNLKKDQSKVAIPMVCFVIFRYQKLAIILMIMALMVLV
ncbi:hypothetical protein [Clostridium sp. C2-6-12]|uniref:hypothetical protein n=1 Tax=Clostridium sp. C2-6-12 TaxID=2698832 RepID=UPI001A9C0450|nr:hypothetical protein [Clostridium sp. C2-6-12]